jgi:hypothetical protein
MLLPEVTMITNLVFTKAKAFGIPTGMYTVTEGMYDHRGNKLASAGRRIEPGAVLISCRGRPGRRRWVAARLRSSEKERGGCRAEEVDDACRTRN